MFTFKKYAYLFVAPALAVVVVFALAPVVHSLVLSFFHLDLHWPEATFAGLDNYAAIISDGRTAQALYHTFLFTGVSVAVELVLGLLLALALSRVFRGVGMARALMMVPWAIPTVVAALLWRWIFNDRFGLLNAALAATQLASAPEAFLASPLLARAAVIVSEVWKATPFMALLLLAGLSLIPGELYESSLIDGATAWQRFRFITLPLLVPSMLVALLFRTMDALRIFDTVYVLTGGGPGNSTETISLYTYKTMFSFLDIGRGSALAVVTFVTVLAVSLGYILLLRREPE